MSNNLPKFLEIVDLFGIRFSFLTFSKRSYHTIIGVILSLMVIFLIIFFIFYLGIDFFLQQNPKITQIYNHPKNSDKSFIHLRNNNFTFAWRLETPGGDPFNYTNILYPGVVYESFLISNESIGQRAKINKTAQSLDIDKCDVSFVTDPYFLELEGPSTLQNWNCVNFDKYNITLGGLFLTTDFFNLVFRVYFCPNGDFYSPKCTSFEKLKPLLYTSNVYFSIYYPKYYYDVLDKERPLKTQYKNQRVLLDLFLNRQDRLYYEESVLNNDKGIIFDEENPTSVLTQTKYENYFTSVLETTWQGYDKDKSFGEDNLWDFIYLMRIYLDKDYLRGNLRYMKAQELAAIIGGLMTVLFNVGYFITSLLTPYYQNLSFINEYFEFSNSNYDKFKKAKTNMDILAKPTEDDLLSGLGRKIIINDGNNIRPLEIDFSGKKNYVNTHDSDKDMLNSIENIPPITSGREENKKITNGPYKYNNPSKFSKMSYKVGNSGYSGNYNNIDPQQISDSIINKKDSSDIDKLKKNVFINNNETPEFYNLKKPKGDLVITEHTLSKRNKIYKSKDTYKDNEEIESIFHKYKDNYEHKQEDMKKREFKFDMGTYFCYTIKNMCCKSKLTKEELNDLKIYNYASDFVHKTLDIVSYIKLQSTVERLKILTLPGNHQSLSFEMFKKPNLNNPEELINFDMDVAVNNQEELKEMKLNKNIAVMKYYAENFNLNNEIEKNALVYDMLDPSYKLYIIDAAKEIEKNKNLVVANKQDDILNKQEGI